MPKEILMNPAWSFVCETVVTDARSQHMSFINQFDDVYYRGAPETFESNEHQLIPLPLQMVFTWNWDVHNSLTVKEKEEIRPSAATVRFVSPTGTLLVTQENVPFVQTRLNPRLFTGVIKVVNFPVLGWGEYTITVTPIGHEDSVHNVSLLLGRSEAPAKVVATKAKKKKKRASPKKTTRK